MMVVCMSPKYHMVSHCIWISSTKYHQFYVLETIEINLSVVEVEKSTISYINLLLVRDSYKVAHCQLFSMFSGNLRSYKLIFSKSTNSTYLGFFPKILSPHKRPYLPL